MNDTGTLSDNSAVSVPSTTEARRLKREAKATATIQKIRNPNFYVGSQPVRISAKQRRAALLARVDHDKGHLVYFVYCAGRVKIGTTTDGYKRASGLSTGTPNPTWVLYSMPGGKVTEYALHCRFEGYRMHGEWFEFCPSLREFILEYGGRGAAMALEEAEWLHREWVREEAEWLLNLYYTNPVSPRASWNMQRAALSGAKGETI